MISYAPCITTWYHEALLIWLILSIYLSLQAWIRAGISLMWYPYGRKNYSCIAEEVLLPWSRMSRHLVNEFPNISKFTISFTSDYYSSCYLSCIEFKIKIQDSDYLCLSSVLTFFASTICFFEFLSFDGAHRRPMGKVSREN